MTTNSKTYKTVILIILIIINILNMFVNISMQTGDDGIFMIIFVAGFSFIVGLFTFILCDILANLEIIKENTSK